MPRLYLNLIGWPFYSNERGVGIGMANDRADVLLVQYLLKAMLHAGKAYSGTPFTRPSGPELNINGVWGEASKRYLEHFEERHRAWKHNNTGSYYGTTIPGTVVPYSQGGKKIQWINHFCTGFYGKDALASLKFPNVTLPDELRKYFFVDFVHPGGI